MPAKPKPAPATAADDVPVAAFEWTCKRTGDTVHLIAAGDMEYGAFEDALESEAGYAALVRGACVGPEDHAALRRLRMREVNDLFTAWNGGSSVGESASSSD